MKALTITQPWCGLVASGIKLVENRSWKPPASLIGQRFALHASRHVDAATFPCIIDIAPDVLQDPVDGEEAAWHVKVRTMGMLITSAIVGVATLQRSVCADEVFDLPDDQRRWFFGPVGYVLTDVRRLVRAIPCKGALSFWTVPEEIERDIEAQLGRQVSICEAP